MLWVNVGLEGKGNTIFFLYFQISKHIQNQFNSYMITLASFHITVCRARKLRLKLNAF